MESAVGLKAKGDEKKGRSSGGRTRTYRGDSEKGVQRGKRGAKMSPFILRLYSSQSGNLQ